MTAGNYSILVPDEYILEKIFLVRGQKVMLDWDLAELYGVTTGNLNKAVKRNIRRFPDDFMFQLNQNEFESLKFQFGISNWVEQEVSHMPLQNRGLQCCQEFCIMKKQLA